MRGADPTTWSRAGSATLDVGTHQKQKSRASIQARLRMSEIYSVTLYRFDRLLASILPEVGHLVQSQNFSSTRTGRLFGGCHTQRLCVRESGNSGAEESQRGQVPSPFGLLQFMSYKFIQIWPRQARAPALAVPSSNSKFAARNSRTPSTALRGHVFEHRTALRA
jgi:hypothetical protein